jgi:putative salt-induced outer membrane protein YdiY
VSVLPLGAHKRYVGVVRTVGGLKLALEGAARDDRHGRFANVSLSAADAKDDVALVTDSHGRMRYRLADGDYLLRVAGGLESRFTVQDGRWTTVRMRLP